MTVDPNYASAFSHAVKLTQELDALHYCPALDATSGPTLYVIHLTELVYVVISETNNLSAFVEQKMFDEKLNLAASRAFPERAPDDLWGLVSDIRRAMGMPHELTM